MQFPKHLKTGLRITLEGGANQGHVGSMPSHFLKKVFCRESPGQEGKLPLVCF